MKVINCVGGVITPPCGVPASGNSMRPSVCTPACSHLLMSLSKTPSRIRWLTISRR